MERHLKQPVHEERAVGGDVCPVTDDLLLRVDPLCLAVAEVPHELGEVDECLVVHGVNADDAGRQGHGGHYRLWKRKVGQYVISHSPLITIVSHLPGFAASSSLGSNKRVSGLMESAIEDRRGLNAPGARFRGFEGLTLAGFSACLSGEDKDSLSSSQSCNYVAHCHWISIRVSP